MDKILRRRFGVAADIDMEKGTAIMAITKPTVLDFAAFADAIQKSSHRLRSVRLEISGRFEGSAVRPEFVIARTDQRLTVAPGSKPLPSERVRVEGLVESWSQPVLKIEKVGPAP